MKPLSAITRGFTESVIREMTRIVDAHGGYNLAQGFPDWEAPAAVKEAAQKAIAADLNQYSITHGDLALRRAIVRKASAYNNITADPETEVTVTCGATEAMIAALLAIINPGDEVILFEPFYENYGPDAILSGARPRYVTLHRPDWRLDEEELKAAFNRRTKAVIVNTPHNPSGKVFTAAELRLIADLCLEWDCLAITDEIYEHILYDGRRHVSLAALEGMAGRTVTVNSISKTYSLTGWRVGWAIAAPEITSRIRKVHDFLTVGAPRPLQAAAALALGLDEAYYEALKADYQRRRDFLHQVLQKLGFEPSRPQGSYYIMAQVGWLKNRLKIESDLALCRRLIELIKVAAVPGSSFYAAAGRGGDEIRFSFCKKDETLEGVRQSLKRLPDLI